MPNPSKRPTDDEIKTQVSPEVYAAIYTRGFADGAMMVLEEHLTISAKRRMQEFAMQPVEGRVN